MRTRDIDVVAAGHVCLDIIPGFSQDRQYKVEEVFSPGKIVDVQQVAVSTGGPVSNTGIALVKLGMKVSFIAKIGDDDFGRLTLNRLKNWASVEGLSISREEHSSYTVAIAPTGIDRIFFHSPGTNHTFSAADVDYALCGQARLFHLGYPPLMRGLYQNGGEQLVEIFRRVKEQGTTTSLDMALPDPRTEAGRIDWRVIFEKLLPFVDIFHPSAEEALFMVNRKKWERLRVEAGGGDLLDLLTGEDFAELSDQLLQWGAAIVTHKSGHRGFYLRTAGRDRIANMGSAKPADGEAWAARELWGPAYRVKPIASATGSGDSSLAGFSAAFLRGEAPERCVAIANTLGCQNLHALDAVSGIEDWEQTLKTVADLSQPKIDMPDWKGWRFDQQLEIGQGPKEGKA